MILHGGPPPVPLPDPPFPPPARAPQAAEKLVLAEGSKMAAAAFQGPAAQGVYGLVAGLGSIVVRTLFQPFEEAAFLAFSREQGERCGSAAEGGVAGSAGDDKAMA